MKTVVLDKNIMQVYSTPPDHPWRKFASVSYGFHGVEIMLQDYNASCEWDLIDKNGVRHHQITFTAEEDLTYFLLRFSS